MDDDVEAQVTQLTKEGRHGDAAALLATANEPVRAAELYAAVWRWAEAIAVTEAAGAFDHAYRHALSANDREACGRLLVRLEAHPDQAVRAAVHAENKGLLLDAARLREAAGEEEAAADLFERAGEYHDAARCRLALGQERKAGILLERRLRDDPDDADAALALGRLLARFARYEHAIRALQRAAESEEHQLPALRLLVACFHALGMDEAAGSRLDALRVLAPDTPVTVPDFLERAFGDRRGILALGGEQPERLLAGRYRIVRPLGAGGTGRVLLAHDAFHEREVAIKILNVGGGAVGRDAFVRFGREARVAAGISHPNVVRVFEFNADGPFLVMEYMAGGTLEERIIGADDAPRPYSPAQTLLVARAMLSALEAVHRRGVVHRDLKPANVFFSGSGEIKLGDFGVAHLTDLTATLTGALVGTLAYMAPEQITGSKKPDAATDLYSLGIILFRCLTGRLPFEGPDFVAQHLDQAPPRASEVAPWLGDAFDPLLDALLAKEPRARPASANDVLDRLRPLPWTSVGEARPPSVRPPAPSEPAPPSDRYRVLEMRGRVALAHDELLDRTVELVALAPAETDRVRAFARADHPFLQTVYAIDEANGQAVLERPEGDRWSALDERRRAAAVAQLREAIKRLHAEGVVHGAVDERHVVVSRSRACLRLALAVASNDPQSDWAALDAIGGRAR